MILNFQLLPWVVTVFTLRLRGDVLKIYHSYHTDTIIPSLLNSVSIFLFAGLNTAQIRYIRDKRRSVINTVLRVILYVSSWWIR